MGSIIPQETILAVDRLFVSLNQMAEPKLGGRLLPQSMFPAPQGRNLSANRIPCVERGVENTHCFAGSPLWGPSGLTRRRTCAHRNNQAGRKNNVCSAENEVIRLPSVFSLSGTITPPGQDGCLRKFLRTFPGLSGNRWVDPVPVRKCYDWQSTVELRLQFNGNTGCHPLSTFQGITRL